MKKAILAKKIGMTQIFDKEGKIVPVTVVEAGPCVILQKKTIENDGYNSIQVGFEIKKDKNINKPLKGHFEKSGLTSGNFRRTIKEFRLEDITSYEVGAEIKADIFVEGDKVDIAGTSKGKGYQGAIKRHNYSRGPMTHGSKYHRKAGSMGGSSTPSRTRKGKKMAGHMGFETVTVQNLEIVKVDVEKNILLVKGAVPGPNKGTLYIKNSVKA